jgi:hypothetical protein
VAVGLIVKSSPSFTAPQVVGGSLVVSVRLIMPADMSAALGVYVVLRADALAKVPVPDVDHVDDVAEPPIVPVTVTISPAQIV